MRWVVCLVVLVALPLSARSATLSTELSSTAFGTSHVGSEAQQTQTLTITNDDTAGDLRFTVTSDLADYTVEPASGTVAPGTEVDVVVRFTPTARGSRTATLTVATPDDAANPSDTFSLTGSGTSGNLVVEWADSPAALDFGTEAVAGGTSMRTITVSNPAPANEPLTFSLTISSGMADYSVPMTIDVVLAVDASQQITVTFDPSTANTRTGIATIDSDDALTPSRSVDLTGVGEGAAFDASPTPIDFGTVPVGEFAEQTLTVTNTGNQPGDVTAIASGDSVFTTTVVGAALPRTLAPSETLELTVRFTPVTGAIVTSDLTLTTTGTPASLQVPLTGDGLYEAVTIVATGESDLAIDLGARRVGVAITQLVTVTNSGELPLTLELPSASAAACTITPTSPATLPAELAPDAAATFSITVMPAAVGAGACTVTVETDIPTTDTFDLSWQGIAPEVELAAPSSPAINFGVVDVDATQLIRTVVLDNTGGAPLAIGPCTIAGSARFVMLTSCANLTVAPNASATLMVGFDPAVEAAETATLTIGVDALSTSEVVIELAGVGADQRLDVSTFAVSFPDTNILEDAAPIEYIDVLNPVNPDTGVAETLTISMATSDNAVFTLSNQGPFTVEAGAMIRIAITFRPDAAGTYDGTLTILSDATALPMAVVTLHGRGIAAATAQSGGCCDAGPRPARPNVVLALAVVALVLRRRRSVESGARRNSRSR